MVVKNAVSKNAVSIAKMLPLGKAHAQAPSRLALYKRARMSRVATIQEYTRLDSQARQSAAPPHQSGLT